MYSIVKRLDFCYGHRLLDYEGKCAWAHGHNALLEVEICREELDSRGMVIDFNEVKRSLGGLLDQLDHRMLLRRDDPLVEALRGVGDEPFVMEQNPTAENIAELIFREGCKLGLDIVSVRLWETPDSCAEYRP